MKVSYKTFWVVIIQYATAYAVVYNFLQPILFKLWNLEPISGEFVGSMFVACSGSQLLKKKFIPPEEKCEEKP